MANSLNISTERYGLWFSSTEMKFLNEEYNFYIKVFNDKIKPFKEPITYHSRVYQELSLNQKTIIRYYYIQTHKEKIISYHKLQDSDSIYYLSKAQLLFAYRVPLPKHLKNAEHYKEVLKKHNKL